MNLSMLLWMYSLVADVYFDMFPSAAGIACKFGLFGLNRALELWASAQRKKRDGDAKPLSNSYDVSGTELFCMGHVEGRTHAMFSILVAFGFSLPWRKQFFEHTQRKIDIFCKNHLAKI